MLIYAQMKDDGRFHSFRLSLFPFSFQPRADIGVSEGILDFEPRGNLFVACCDESLGHSVAIGDATGYQLTDEPNAYQDTNPVPIKLDSKWVVA